MVSVSLDSDAVLKYEWFRTIFSDQYRSPDILDTLRSCRDSNSPYRVSVYALLQRGNNVGLVSEDKGRTFGFPGGEVKRGERLGQALAREMTEEIPLLKSGSIHGSWYHLIDKGTDNTYITVVLVVDHSSVSDDLADRLVWASTVDLLTGASKVQCSNHPQYDSIYGSRIKPHFRRIFSESTHWVNGQMGFSVYPVRSIKPATVQPVFYIDDLNATAIPIDRSELVTDMTRSRRSSSSSSSDRDTIAEILGGLGELPTSLPLTYSGDYSTFDRSDPAVKRHQSKSIQECNRTEKHS